MQSIGFPKQHLSVWSTRDALVDATVAAVVLAGTWALIAHGGIPGSTDTGAALDGRGILLAVCSAAPLLAWRRAPVAVFAICAGAGIVLTALDYPLGLPLGATVALYLLTASRPDGDRSRRRTAAVAGLFVAYLVVSAAARQGFPTSELLHTGVAWAFGWFAGDRTRLWRQHVVELRERAVRAERDAIRDRALARADERARIARDLHDSSAHAINVIAVRAGAARLRHEHDPDRSQAALETIEELARQTAEEIDQIVGTLRESSPADGSVEAPPGLASLGTLVARYEAEGLDVTLDAETRPRAIGRSVDQALYRILQEALTNAARHGTGSARIEVAFHDEACELEVTNPVAAERSPRARGGHGLIGVRERASLLGGCLDVGRHNGTFRVHALLPYEGRRT